MSNQIDDFADFLAGITPEERTTLAGLRDGTLVAVPREPTEAMIKAGERALSGWIAPPMHSDVAYSAMLAAAPEAPGRG